MSLVRPTSLDGAQADPAEGAMRPPLGTEARAAMQGQVPEAEAEAEERTAATQLTIPVRAATAGTGSFASSSGARFYGKFVRNRA